MNDKIKAFPSMEQCGSIAVSEGGMDLRDYFAAKFASVLLDKTTTYVYLSGEAHISTQAYKQTVKMAYEMADAMIEWRQ